EDVDAVGERTPKRRQGVLGGDTRRATMTEEARLPPLEGRAHAAQFSDDAACGRSRSSSDVGASDDEPSSTAAPRLARRATKSLRRRANRFQCPAEICSSAGSFTVIGFT